MESPWFDPQYRIPEGTVFESVYLHGPFPRSEAMDEDEDDDIGILVAETDGVPVVWVQTDWNGKEQEWRLEDLIRTWIRHNTSNRGEISKSAAFNLRQVLNRCVAELDKYTPCDDEERMGEQVYQPAPAEAK